MVHTTCYLKYVCDSSHLLNMIFSLFHNMKFLLIFQGLTEVTNFTRDSNEICYFLKNLPNKMCITLFLLLYEHACLNVFLQIIMQQWLNYSEYILQIEVCRIFMFLKLATNQTSLKSALLMYLMDAWNLCVFPFQFRFQFLKNVSYMSGGLI